MMKQTAQQYLQRGIRWLIGVGLFGSVGVGGYFSYLWFSNSASDSLEVEVIAVEKGDVIRQISVGGLVKLGNQQTLKAPASANSTVIVEQVAVSLNTTVQQGQILIRLRDPEGQTNVEQQRLVIEQRQLDLLTKQREIQQAEVDLAQAQDELQRFLGDRSTLQKAENTVRRNRQKIQEQQAEITPLEQELNSIVQLVQQGYIAENDQLNQEKELRQARSSLREFEQQLRDAQLELQNQQIQWEQKKRQLQDTLQGKKITLQNRQNEFKNAQKELENARLDFTKREETFEKNSLIRATISGRVLDIQVKPGDVLTPGATLLTLGNPEQEEVELSLPPLQAALVQPNQKAKVEVIGFQSGQYPATVFNISQIATPGSEENRGQEQGKVKAIVQLNRPTRTLIPGSQVGVDIIIEEAIAVKRLPPHVLQDTDGSKALVWVVNEQNEAEKKPVTLGLVGNTHTEIKSGLAAGEKVISLSTPDSLTPGMKVVVKESGGETEE